VSMGPAGGCGVIEGPFCDGCFIALSLELNGTRRRSARKLLASAESLSAVPGGPYLCSAAASIT
jgi:hypothetical protein